MRAVWMRARADLRARLRATVAIVLLIGLGGGAVLASAAGARRTDTAYPRFLEAYGGAHVLAGTSRAGEASPRGPRPDLGGEIPLAEIAALPSVAAVGIVRLYVFVDPDRVGAPGEEAAFVGAARVAGGAGGPVDGAKILEGRTADPGRADEAVLSMGAPPWLRVGSRVRLAGIPDFPGLAAALRRDPIVLRVVGRAAVPGDFPPQVGDESIHAHLTPAFARRYPEQGFGIPGGFLVRLREGARGLRAFLAEYERIGGDPEFVIGRARHDANVQRSIHLQALALWLLAAFAAVALLLIAGQTLARDVSLGSDENPALRALGSTRGQLFAVGMARVLATAAAGAVVAAAAAVLLSALTPIRLARLAEPHPGLAADATVLSAGAVAIVALAGLLTAWPAWRAARLAAARDETVPSPSAVASALARMRAGPAVVTGARLALERGRGRSAMPVRSTIAGLVLGVFVLGAGTTFANSLDHLVDTPRLYGVRWTARVGAEVGRDLAALGRRLLAEEPVVEGVAIGRTGFEIEAGGRTLELLAQDAVGGREVRPPLVRGRYPRPREDGALEVVLGTKAFERLGARLGGRLALVVPGRGPIPARVVGAGVVPSLTDQGRLGESALVSVRALAPLGVEPIDLFLDVDRDAAAAAQRERSLPYPVYVDAIARIAGASPGDEVHEWPPASPRDVVNFGGVQHMPSVLGGLLAAYAAAALAHTLLTAVARRRRELAVLKTLGFVGRQVRRAVGVQATLLAAIALAVGVPTGVAAARWLWTLFADANGVVPEPLIHGASLAVLVPLVLLVARAIAALPARAAARTRPASVLRTE